MFSWYMKLFTFATIVTLASTQSQSPFIRRTGCQYQPKTGSDKNQGTITHQAQKKCTYFVETLALLASDILVMNTASLNCSGSSTSVLFATNMDGNEIKNFCNKTECLVYTRRKYSYVDKHVMASIGHPFPECKSYNITKKPSSTKITVSKGTSFVLEFKVFNLTIPTTASTTTITSRKVRVEGSTQAGTIRAMSSAETDIPTTTAGSTQAGTIRAMSSAETDIPTTTAGPTHTTTNRKMTESTAPPTKASPTTAQAIGETTYQSIELTTMADVTSELTSNQAHVLSTISAEKKTQQRTNGTSEFTSNETHVVSTISSAKNTSQGQESEYKKKTGSKPWHYALPITLAVILFIICILIFFICKRRKAKNKKGSEVSAVFISEEKKI